MEKYYKVIPVKTVYSCDNDGCNDTEIVFTGRAFPTSPYKYEHICEKCKKTYILNKKYPLIEYLEE